MARKKHRGEGTPYAKHIPALDGIRALAIASVMATHLFPGTAATPFTRLIRTSLSLGVYGVDIFFALSGFLITGILYESLHDERYFRKFYVRRALRIFPLYYGVLFLFLLAQLLFPRDYGRELWSLALYLQNTNWVAPKIWLVAGSLRLPLAHFWSLAVEEQFYLFWPLVVFLLRQRRRLLLATIVLSGVSLGLRTLAAHHGATTADLNTSTVYRLDSLLLGGTLALLLRGRWHDKVLRYAPWVLLMAVSLDVSLVKWAGVVAPALNSFWASLHYTGVALWSTALIATTLRPDGIAETIFSLRPMRWLGRYSYGVYVLHLPLLLFLRVPLWGFLLNHVTQNRGLVGTLVGFLVGGLTLVLAPLSYNMYEKRFLKLKRYFEYRRHPNTPTVSEVGVAN